MGDIWSYQIQAKFTLRIVQEIHDPNNWNSEMNFVKCNNL